MKMMSLEKLALLAIPNPSAALHYVPKFHGCYEAIDVRAYQLMTAVYREHHRVNFGTLIVFNVTFIVFKWESLYINLVVDLDTHWH